MTRFLPVPLFALHATQRYYAIDMITRYIDVTRDGEWNGHLVVFSAIRDHDEQERRKNWLEIVETRTAKLRSVREALGCQWRKIGTEVDTYVTLGYVGIDAASVEVHHLIDQCPLFRISGIQGVIPRVHVDQICHDRATAMKSRNGKLNA